jgi:excisionase family DNA binding protein
MEINEIEKRLANIESLLLSQKNVLTFDEGATYMGISKSHLYKMTMLGTIAYYKPRGKMIYFDRAELEKWLLQNRITPADEIEAKANTYVTLNKRGQ